MSGSQLKRGDLVTFVYNLPKVTKLDVYADQNKPMQIHRAAYARRVLKAEGGRVTVNFKGRLLDVPEQHVQKVWC